MYIRNKSDILGEAFGCWIVALFGSVPLHNTDYTFKDHKKAFFVILKKWLDDGDILFMPPINWDGSGYQKPIRRQYDCVCVWNIPHDDMITYMKAHWPKDVTHEHDSDLNYYWYSNTCPVILWVDHENQTTVAS